MLSRSAIYILSVALLLLGNTACKKDILKTSGGELRFSTDTLTFDTVFTAYASYTEWIKIFNPSNQKVIISSVRLENGNNSYFNINVNGIEGNSVTDIEVAANDSFYVFATVNVDPNNDDNPFLITDRIIATLNGQEFSIPLVAYGQNAYYIDGNTDNGFIKTETWKTDKPYVVLHSALVDSGHTLTIPAGCRIYMNADSRLYVKGTLKVEGTKEDSVIFQGGRLDRKYFGNKGYPGEWGGIYFFEYSYDNEINYAVIKNCGSNIGAGLPSAIQLSPDLVIQPGITYQLTLRNTVIENSIGYGILSFQGSLKAENCLVHTCGAQALAIIQGGEYDINNCDFVIYGTEEINHTKEPALAVLNYFDVGNGQYIAHNLKANFRNCIVWGSLDEEAFFDKVDQYGYDLKMENCAIKHQEPIPSIVNHINTINQFPEFEDYGKWNFRLRENSPLLDKGVFVSDVLTDLDGKPRSNPPDIGCYER